MNFSTPFSRESSSFDLYDDIPLYKRCTCKTCLDRANNKKRSRVLQIQLQSSFPQEDLIDFLNKYWETLKHYGPFLDQLNEPFQQSAKANCLVYIQPRQYHLILWHLQTKDDLQQWRRSITEYQTFEGYNGFYCETTKWRLDGTHVRASGENDSNKARKRVSETHVSRLASREHVNQPSSV